MTISEQVRKVLQDEYNSGVTQTKLAEKYGIDQGYISCVISGKKKPSLQLIDSVLHSHPSAENIKGGAVVINNGGNNYGNAINNFTLSDIIKKITDTEALTAEEKIKFIKVIQS